MRVDYKSCRIEACIFYKPDERMCCVVAAYKRRGQIFIKNCPMKKGWKELIKIIALDRWLQKNREDLKWYQAKWRKRNRQKYLKYHAAYRARKRLGRKNNVDRMS